MLGIGWLSYVIGGVLLGLTQFAWWTPPVAGIFGTALYLSQFHAREPIRHALYADPSGSSDHDPLRAAVWAMLHNGKALGGLSQYIVALYLMNVVLAYALFGVGRGVSYLL
jgi:hypothetical protein